MKPDDLPPPGPQATTWQDPIPPENETVILVLAPTGNDARLTVEFLEAASFSTRVMTDMADLCRQVAAGCGAVLLAEEVLTNTSAAQLFSVLRQQPAWSEVPITLVTSKGAAGAERMQRIAGYGIPGNITILERPFRPGTLVNTLEVALRSRRRQYQLRRLMAQLQQARDDAEHASRAKDEFLAALSHELRTPLNPVLLLATEGAGNPRWPQPVRDDFGQIARHVMLEARLIDDLLDLTSITRGKLSLNQVAVDAHAAVRAALTTVQAEIEERRQVVSLDLRATRPVIMADPVRLQQVLWNLLKNAAKFTPAGGSIWLASCNQGEGLSLVVRDSGIGMEPDELARVFDAFAQGNHARNGQRHRFGGLGLGLAISRRLMELHGGSISASSAGPERGSTFTLSFPAAAAVQPRVEPAAAPRATPPGAEAADRRILLVEDHAATREAIKRLLERRGFRVHAAGSLAAARAAVAASGFDLLLSDLGLPDGSGYELMAEIRRDRELKGIALSGYGTESDIAQSVEAGFSAHLTKPISAEALDAALARALRLGVSAVQMPRFAPNA